MRAVTFDISVSRYILGKAAGAVHRALLYRLPATSPLRYGEVPPPRLPGPDWVRVRTVYGGICGSDLSVIFLAGSPSTSPCASFPFVPGHENVGVVEECGPGVPDLRPGDRVVADPLLACAPRGVDPPCPRCAEGNPSQCENFARGNLAPGLLIGACRDTGGSWGEAFVAHRSQVFRVPAGVSDAAALMVEPFCSALHPLLRHPPRPGERVLVIGAGVIGLLLVAGIRALGHGCHVTVLSRYGFQADAARRLGADAVVGGRGDYYAELARIAGARLYRPLVGRQVSTGGFDRIFDCVGSGRSIDDALRLSRGGGTVVIVGLAAIPRGIDWTPVWLKELTIRGTFAYGIEDPMPAAGGAAAGLAPAGPGRAAGGEAAGGEAAGGRAAGGEGRAHTFALALGLMAEGRLRPAELLTHTYPLHRWREAIAAASDKGRYRSIKVAFTPG